MLDSILQPPAQYGEMRPISDILNFKNRLLQITLPILYIFSLLNFKVTMTMGSSPSFLIFTWISWNKNCNIPIATSISWNSVISNLIHKSLYSLEIFIQIKWSALLLSLEIKKNGKKLSGFYSLEWKMFWVVNIYISIKRVTLTVIVVTK